MVRRRSRRRAAVAAALLLAALPARAESDLALPFPDPFGTFRGVIHDPDGRAIGVNVVENVLRESGRVYLRSEAGVDGSMRKHLKDMRGMVFCKTGTIKGVRSLAGLVFSKDGRCYAFAILFNGYKGPAAPYKQIQEQLCRVLGDARMVLCRGGKRGRWSDRCASPRMRPDRGRRST